jgi:hypothetical protein
VGYLLFVVVVSIVGITIVVRKTRRPASMEAGIEEFSRTMQALGRARRRTLGRGRTR